MSWLKRRARSAAAVLRAIGALADRIERIEAATTRLLRDVEAIRYAATTVLGPDRAITALATGQRLYIDPRDGGCGLNLIVDGRYEEDELRVLRRFLRDGATVLDVGANYGYYAIGAGPYVRPSGRVIGFEPNPHIHRLFANSIYVNGLADVVEARRLAVSDHAGRATFEIAETEPGGGRIVASAGDVAAGRHGIDVEIVRLDDHLPPDMVVDAVKIDVEGHETRVLDGMRAIVARSPRIGILMEYIDGFFPDDAARGRLLRLVRDELGLGIHRVLAGGRTEPVADAALRGQCCTLLLCRHDPAEMPDIAILPSQLRCDDNAERRDGAIVWRGIAGDALRPLAHGPYVFLPRGRYRLDIDGDFDGHFVIRIQENVGDIVHAAVLAEGLRPSLSFVLLRDAPWFEVAILCRGDREAAMTLRRIELRSE